MFIVIKVANIMTSKTLMSWNFYSENLITDGLTEYSVVAEVTEWITCLKFVMYFNLADKLMFHVLQKM